MKKIIVYPLLLVIVSCFSTRKHKEYVSDFKNLSREEYSNKYYTLNTNQILDFTNLKKNTAYTISKTSDTFQVYVFSDDGYVYSSVLLMISNFNNISNEKLYGARIFSIDDKIIKFEKVASNPEGVFSFIEEGVIRNDTIFMSKSYPSKNHEKITNLSEKIIISPNIEVHKLGEYIFVETK